MIKDVFSDTGGIDISDDMMAEIIILYSLGVDIQELKYFLALKENY